MKKNKKPTVKDVVLYMLKQRGGINFLIAVKEMYAAATGDYSKFYRGIAIALQYNRTIEDIYFHYHWELSMYKDHAQYQNH